MPPVRTNIICIIKHSTSIWHNESVSVFHFVVVVFVLKGCWKSTVFSTHESMIQGTHSTSTCQLPWYKRKTITAYWVFKINYPSICPPCHKAVVMVILPAQLLAQRALIITTKPSLVPFSGTSSTWRENQPFCLCATKVAVPIVFLNSCRS